MHKLATTVYGLVGFDWIRMTLARVDAATLFVRADGSNAPVKSLPERFRTCDDIGNVAAQLGHNVNIAAVPSVGLSAHEWKESYTLAELAEHKFQGPALKANMAALLASYEAAAQIAA